MHQTSKLHELLYVSTIAAEAPVTVVAEIARSARAANKLMDITGLLVFDGQRFAQLLEGSMKTVVQLFENISMDTRHDNICLLHQGPAGQRKFFQFSMGFADVDDDDVLGALEKLTGVAALAAFTAMHSKLDLPS